MLNDRLLWLLMVHNGLCYASCRLSSACMKRIHWHRLIGAEHVYILQSSRSLGSTWFQRGLFAYVQVISANDIDNYEPCRSHHGSLGLLHGNAGCDVLQSVFVQMIRPISQEWTPDFHQDSAFCSTLCMSREADQGTKAMNATSGQHISEVNRVRFRCSECPPNRTQMVQTSRSQSLNKLG